MGFDALQPWHIIVLVIVLVLLFGSRRLPGAAKSLGESMNIFKRSVSGLHDDDNAANPPQQTSAFPQQASAFPPAPVTPPAVQAGPDATQQQLADLQRQLNELQKQSAGTTNGQVSETQPSPQP